MAPVLSQVITRGPSFRHLISGMTSFWNLFVLLVVGFGPLAAMSPPPGAPAPPPGAPAPPAGMPMTPQMMAANAALGAANNASKGGAPGAPGGAPGAPGGAPGAPGGAPGGAGGAAGAAGAAGGKDKCKPKYIASHRIMMGGPPMGLMPRAMRFPWMHMDNGAVLIQAGM